MPTMRQYSETVSIGGPIGIPAPVEAASVETVNPPAEAEEEAQDEPEDDDASDQG